MDSRPGLLPKPGISIEAEAERGADGIDRGTFRGDTGSFVRVAAKADAALIAVRTLRRAMRSSRDHFMTGQCS
jgi:hypothetical protein